MFKKHYLLFLSLFLMACQPALQNTQPAAPSHTGENTYIVQKNDQGQIQDIIQAPYTAAGNPEAFQELKTQVQNIPIDYELIDKLKTIEVDPKKYNHGAALTNTQSKPDVVVLKYVFNGNDSIIFTIPLEPKAIAFYKGIDPLVEKNNHNLARATSENKSNYEVQLQCLDINCKSIKFIIVEKNTKRGIGVKYSQKKVPMSVDSSQKQKNFVQHLLTPSGKELLKRDYSIVGGPSFSEVWMNVQDSRVIYFKTDLAFTGNSAIPIPKVYLSKPKKLGQRLEYHKESIAQGNLIGNDEENGDIWVQFKLNDNFYQYTQTEKQASNAEFAITTGSQEPVVETRTGEVNPQNSYFKIQNSAAKKMSQQLSRYKNQVNSSVYSYIQAYIDIYTGQYDGKYKTFRQLKCHQNVSTNEKAKLQSFYNNIHPALSLLQKEFENLGVAPEFSLLMVIESNYPKDYRIEKAYCNNCSAYGPFQITNATAKDLVTRFSGRYGVSTAGLKVSSTPQQHTYDYRNFLLPSARMAAVYMRHFSELLNYTRPELYAVAYNGGPGQIVDKKAPEYLNYDNTTLDKLARFMPPNTCKYGFVDYGFKFLALKLISDDYKAYGFELNPKQFSNFYHMNQVMKLKPQSI